MKTTARLLTRVASRVIRGFWTVCIYSPRNAALIRASRPSARRSWIRLQAGERAAAIAADLGLTLSAPGGSRSIPSPPRLLPPGRRWRARRLTHL